jgi:hypothetical protein
MMELKMENSTSEKSIEKIRKGRGPGKKPALICTSIRLPKEVMDFFSLFPDKQAKMRDVLSEYVMFQNMIKK